MRAQDLFHGPLHLSTASLPTSDRLPFWREVFGQTMVRLDIEAMKGTSFHAEGTLCALAGAAVASVTTTPVRVARTKRLIAGDMADNLFIVTADAPLHFVQGGREHLLDAGDAIFLRGAECSTIQSRQRTRFTNISVPMDSLGPMLQGCQDLSMRVVSRQDDLLGLLLGYVHLLHTSRQPRSDALDHIAAGHIRDLIAAIAKGKPDVSPIREPGGIRAARLCAIRAEIDSCLGEAGLTAESIAACHGISPRYIRKLFQDEGTTFTDFVLERRLDLARRFLLHPGQAGSTIAAISHACGFGDLSYFNRTFRRRFGMTPTDLRNGASRK